MIRRGRESPRLPGQPPQRKVLQRSTGAAPVHRPGDRVRQRRAIGRTSSYAKVRGDRQPADQPPDPARRRGEERQNYKGGRLPQASRRTGTAAVTAPGKSAVPSVASRPGRSPRQSAWAGLSGAQTMRPRSYKHIVRRERGCVAGCAEQRRGRPALTYQTRQRSRPASAGRHRRPGVRGADLDSELRRCVRLGPSERRGAGQERGKYVLVHRLGLWHGTRMSGTATVGRTLLLSAGIDGEARARPVGQARESLTGLRRLILGVHNA